MSAAVPFVVSPEAEQWLSQIVGDPDSHPGLSYTLGFDALQDGELIEEFWGEHFTIGYDSPERWVSVHSAVPVSIAGREFWCGPDTIERLRGKTLTFVQREVGRGSYAGKVRDILVAV
jgi:hypothetical protein